MKGGVQPFAQPAQLLTPVPLVMQVVEVVLLLCTLVPWAHAVHPSPPWAHALLLFCRGVDQRLAQQKKENRPKNTERSYGPKQTKWEVGCPASLTFILGKMWRRHVLVPVASWCYVASYCQQLAGANALPSPPHACRSGPWLIAGTPLSQPSAPWCFWMHRKRATRLRARWVQLWLGLGGGDATALYPLSAPSVCLPTTFQSSS